MIASVLLVHFYYDNTGKCVASGEKRLISPLGRISEVIFHPDELVDKLAENEE